MQASATESTTVLPTEEISPPASSTPWGMVSKPARKKGAETTMAKMPPMMVLWATVLRSGP